MAGSGYIVGLSIKLLNDTLAMVFGAEKPPSGWFPFSVEVDIVSGTHGEIPNRYRTI